MLPPAKTQAELQIQRIKLASSYNELIDEFSSKELRTVGNYTVGRLIGKGSFGKAYLASHKLINGSKVVLKSANKADSNLAREIHHHRQFLHPHIARLYEVVVTESMVWLVLEYCPGNELYHYLLKNGPLPAAMVQNIFTQLVGAVSYVHQKSCVHRDLKLENILLDKRENVKLCDFGFTREYEGKSSYLQTWCGTVCYSAPEMLKGEKYAAEKVDVWSLGVILYALLCGELPFDEDNDTATKMKILKEEPKYPDFLPAAAKDLIVLLLSKRPLLRPSLADILTNQWLSDWAPQQQAILKVQQPAPFTTQLETDTLERMRSAGVNIDSVIENVLSQRCDALAGWWALLLEKEERKEKKRQRKRREREAEIKAARRISTASSRLLASTIKESDEEKVLQDAAPISERGRSQSRNNGDVSAPLTPTLGPPFGASQSTAPKASSPLVPAAEKRLSRPGSSSRRISQLGPGVSSKRNSMLQVVTTDGTVIKAEPAQIPRKRRYQPPFFAHFAHIKHWFSDSKKRGKAANAPSDTAGRSAPRPVDTQRVSSDLLAQRSSTPGQPSDQPARRTPVPKRLSSASSHRRVSSHSPSPLTSQSASRRNTSGNLRGRKSTSSSVSSIRSMHMQHHPSHSKASSVSSASIGSPSNISAKSINAARRRSSPNTPVKVFVAPPPGTSPNAGTTRTVRVPARLNFTDAQQSNPFSGVGPPSPGLMFTRRKRSVFKGPTLGAMNPARRRSDGTGSGLMSAPGEGTTERQSGEVTITEEDEDEIEEVEAFSPIEEGEREFVIEEGEDAGDRFAEEQTALPDELGRPQPLTKWELNA